ncbi:uncharacterized protein [Lolium perenne]|uniref:uncharacterized protein n=1 Tax=Lolium perenne TaxID=4522 RepID=UPI0021EB52B6|nr:flocculation protein FLO11 [Lolium perenne]
MPRPSSTSQPRRASPSPTPSPATAPKPNKNLGSAQRRRSPLSDLNSGDASAARAGCFRFLLSSASASKSRCPSTPRTPASGPPRPRPETTRRVNRLPDQESRTKTEQWPRSRREDPIGGQIRRVEPTTKKKGLARRGQQQLEALTPERKADAGGTPSSSATPPVHASISPEVLAGGAATPACFAAGHHVVPGVRDRRKRRARGILDIAGEGTSTSSELGSDPSRASIHWLSSSQLGEAVTRSTNCAKEASAIWLASPRDEGLLDDEIFLPRCSSEDAFWRLSPDYTGLLGSPVLGGLLDFDTPGSETTPSSGFLPVEKTPSTGDSISPFSLIVKRASSQSSRLSSLCAQQRLGSYCCDSAADPTPISRESWPENASTGKCSGLARVSSRLVARMDPVVECVEMMTLSPRPGDADYDGNEALPAQISFQFAGAPTPLESIDLSSFKRSPCEIELKGKEVSFRKPVSSTETRISWREGLVSRMFDMGDLDCCRWFSDDEDGPVLLGNAEALPDTLPDTTFQHISASCQQEDGERSGFGSVEFSSNGGGELNYDSKATPNPVQVAESMRAEGFELVSSDDSDCWTLLYKNGLFET